MASELDVQNIQGGFGAAAQALGPAAQRQRQEEADTKPLSPFEHQMAAAMAAGITPQQYAAHVKLGIPIDHPALQSSGQSDGLGPEASQASTPSYGYASGLGATTASPTPAGNQPIPYPESQPQGMNRINSQSGPAAASPSPGGLTPQNRGELNTMLQMAPLIRAQNQDSPEERMARLLATAGSREKVAGITSTTKERGQDIRAATEERKLTSHEEQFKQTLSFQKQKLDQHWQETMASLNNRLQTFNARSASDYEFHALKLDLDHLKAVQSSVKGLLTGFTKVTEDPDVLAQLKTQTEELDTLKSGYEHQMAAYKSAHAGNQAGPGQPQTETTRTSVTTPGAGKPPRIVRPNGDVMVLQPDGTYVKGQ